MTGCKINQKEALVAFSRLAALDNRLITLEEAGTWNVEKGYPQPIMHDATLNSNMPSRPWFMIRRVLRQ
jgi:hypothetical protein